MSQIVDLGRVQGRTAAVALSSLRPLRREQGLTLEELARRAELTKSYLSKLERGRSTPSIAIALRLATALNVEVGRLFGETGTAEVIEIDRAARRQRLATPTSTHGSPYDGVAVGLAGKQMTPFVIYPPVDNADGEFHEHDGDELVMVIDGTVEVIFPDRVERLDPGDSAYFKGGVLHRFRSVGEQEATLLVTISTEPCRPAPPARSPALAPAVLDADVRHVRPDSATEASN